MEHTDSKESMSFPSTFEISTALHPDENRKLFLKPCGGPPGRLLSKCRQTVYSAVKKNTSVAMTSVKLLIFAGICVYLVFLFKNFVSTGEHIDWRDGYGKAFIYIAACLWCCLYYKLFKAYIVKYLSLAGKSPVYLKYKKYIRHSICATVGAILILFILYDALSYPRRLVSFLGICTFLLISFLFSKHPEYVRWDVVVSGVLFQILIGIMSIRWDTGRHIIEGVAKNIETFLNYGQSGAVFVYGDFLIRKELVFAFQALSTLYFLCLVTRVLFHLGWLQKFCFKVGGFIEFIIGTTVIESVYAASVVFLGMSEAPLVCAPYIELLTSSEIHTIMAAGHATVAGTLFAAYASLGIDPRYVVTASAMAAPGSLCFSKLLYPENIPSRTSSESIEVLKSKDRSVLEAACKGASAGSQIVHGIIANVIACIALIAFANDTCSWLGNLVGVTGFTLEWLVGQIFVPIAWLMGVIPEECQMVGSLIGIKTMVNEFVAYKQLSELKKKGLISVRSEVIATFALCGFSNPSALGTNIATLTTLAPGRCDNINKIAIRAFITGCIVTFASAAIAGLFTEEEGLRVPTTA